MVLPSGKAERRAYILADNKLAQNAGWDRELLALELQGLIDLDFDVELTGFSLAEAIPCSLLKTERIAAARRPTP
jgi:hypothetical protein